MLNEQVAKLKMTESRIKTGYDAEGSSYLYLEHVLKDGRLLTCPANFKHLKSTVDDLEHLVVRHDDVILTTYAKAGNQ